MDRDHAPQPGTDALIKKLHERPQMPLADWLRAPAHVHYKAFRMSDPPAQRKASREEFQSCLAAFAIRQDNTVLRETFGYGVKEAGTSERLIVIWQAHTEYYNYQIWHLPDPAKPEVAFGPLTFPNYKFPIAPLGTEVCRLDILLSSDSLPPREEMRAMLPGPVLYGSKILDEQTSLVTSFTHDEFERERYWVTLGPTRVQVSRLKEIVDAIVRIETYYHLLLMQKPLFSAAIDQVYNLSRYISNNVKSSAATSRTPIHRRCSAGSTVSRKTC